MHTFYYVVFVVIPKKVMNLEDVSFKRKESITMTVNRWTHQFFIYTCSLISTRVIRDQWNITLILFLCSCIKTANSLICCGKTQIECSPRHVWFECIFFSLQELLWRTFETVRMEPIFPSMRVDFGTFHRIKT